MQNTYKRKYPIKAASTVREILVKTVLAENNYTVIVKPSSECDEFEIDQFVSLVTEGGSIFSEGLRDRVRTACLLSFLYSPNKELIGCMGLKRPSEGYLEDLEEYTKVPIRRYTCIEIGWLFIKPEHRHKGLSTTLRESILNKAKSESIFTVVEETAIKIPEILARYGFIKMGCAYKSSISGKRLQLFIKK